MLRTVVVVSSLLLCAAPAPAQNTRSNLAPLDYYVPDFDEVGLAFSLIQALPAVEPTRLRQILEWYWADESMAGLFVRAYAYHTSDEPARATILAFLSGQDLADVTSHAVRMRYASRAETVPGPGGSRTRYTFEDRLVDEDIDLSSLQDVAPFEHFHVRTFACKWGTWCSRTCRLRPWWVQRMR